MLPDSQAQDTAPNEVTSEEETGFSAHSTITQGFLPLQRPSINFASPEELGLGVDFSNVLFDQSYYLPEDSFEEHATNFSTDPTLLHSPNDQINLF